MSSSDRLRGDALGLAHALAIGIAGTAPAYSLAASSATLIAAVGLLAPASLLYCGLVMGGVASAFIHLNRVYPDSGASYAWVSRVFHRNLGFITGWAVLVSSALFMVSATIPAATATLLLVAPGATDDKLPVIAVAACWLIAVSALVVRGARLTGIVQTIMTVIELCVLAALVLLAGVRFAPWHQLSWSSLSPFSFTPAQFSSGAVIALFFFWGWDVSLNLTEETRDPARTPGVATAFAMVVIVAAFLSFVAVILAVLSVSEIRDAGANVVFAVADKLLPRPWSYVAVVAVMLSSIGTMETSTVQFARTLYSKSRTGLMHRRWSALHASWRTPHLATFLITALGLALLALSLAFPDIDAILQASINAIGLEVAFYYGLASIACASHFRHQARRSPRLLFFAVAWPLASAALLWGVALLAASSMDWTTLTIGIGAVVVGIVPMLLASPTRAKPR